ncbi:glutamine-hydrolyzing carbamoyl-phosphate synthase small subunit [Buchnera aphidicola (Pseudoregma panicola)]|uniref:glutamine-hydrolyzing carbamoyl-phosphate synthase small subunit n=1 Tax=Buchnera aphidicola TaxID=9 RepID=UPI0031B70B6A
MEKKHEKAVLLLENNKFFKGKIAGYKKFSVGEIIFNTSVTGYQEIITDPSYFNQIVLLTSPHIGNTGINYEDNESKSIYLKGLILKDIYNNPNHYKYKKKFKNFLLEKKIISIYDIDTRKLTKILRNSGTKIGCIFEDKKENYKIAKKKILDFKSKIKLKKNKKISTKKIYIFKKSKFSNYFNIKKNKEKLNLVVYDYGVKFSILNIFLNYNCKIIVVPSNTKIKKILKYKPDGILLSNGPGNPIEYKEEIKIVKKILLKTKIPILGICLGHQLLSLSVGLKIKKMKFGHHGSNHPVKEIKTNKILITSQNHNFSVLNKKNKKNIEITHVSLLDNTIQGISIKKRNAISFQGHPEGSPGPHDAKKILKNFLKIMKKYKKNREKKCLKEKI